MSLQLTINKVDYSKLKSHKNNITLLGIKLQNTPISLANTIRRSLLSDLPNVGFNPKNINIFENSSGGHNEFIKHRVSLLPINRANLKIITSWDNKINKRVFNFENNKIPIFQLDKSILNKKLKLETNIKHIMTNEFTVYLEDIDIPIKNLKLRNKIDEDNSNNEEVIFEKITKYFKTDSYTNDYIYFHLLKINPYDSKTHEKISLVAKPVIGTAKINSSFSPIGNVSYEFVKEEESIIKKIITQKIKQINYERKSKDLKELNEIQEKNFISSFNLLDSQRVYKKNKDGDCNNINLTIESINIIQPNTALLDCFTILSLKLVDILQFITITKYNIEIKNKIKLQIRNTTLLTNNNDDEVNEFNSPIIEITVYNEEHTIGNLLTDYLNNLTINDLLDNKKTVPDLEKNKTLKVFEYVSYKVVHPLENILLFQMKLNNTFYNKLGSELFNYYNILGYTPIKLYLLLFVKSIEKVLKHISILESQFKAEQVKKIEEKILDKENLVTESSFNINENDYKYKNITIFEELKDDSDSDSD